MVTINVREDEEEEVKTFYVHKSYADYYSAYFRAAL